MADNSFVTITIVGLWLMIVVFPTIAMLYSPTEWRKKRIKRYKYGSKDYYKCFISEYELDDFVHFLFWGLIFIDILFILMIFTGYSFTILLGLAVGPDALFFHLLSRYWVMKKVDKAREKLADIEREEKLIKEIIEKTRHT